MTLKIDGRLMNAAEFDEYVAGIDTGVERVVIHHTFAPDLATWQKHGGWAYWGERIRQIYQDTRGWDKGPHLFAGPDGFGLFYDLTQDGRAVGGGHLEHGCRHIETVGDYTKALPSGAVLDNVVAAAASLLYHAGLGIEALTYHRAVVDGGSECPGAAWIAAWGWFKSLVAARLTEMASVPEPAPYLPHIVEADVWDLATVLEKARWWLQEMQRAFEAGDVARAEEIRLSLIRWMYSREEAAKAAR